MRAKALLFANTDWYLYNFRLSLARAIQKAGWDVVLVSPEGAYGNKLSKLGFDWRPLPFSTRSANPFRESVFLTRLIRLYLAEHPDLVHHFTIKCVMYGSLVARLLPGVSVVNAVTGLGWAFSAHDLASRVARRPVEWAYRLALSAPNGRVIFQNEGDREAFVGARLVRGDRTRVIRGSGVDCHRFGPGSPARVQKDGRVSVLLASRLLKDKGIREYAAAARILKNRFPRAEFVLAGDFYPENPGSLTKQELQDILSDGAVTYLGHVDEMADLLRSTDIVVLPTRYPEGTPRVLIEAAASEIPIVATDIPACRGLVQDGRTGFLIRPGELNELVAALARLIMDPQLRRTLGREGRRVVLEGFEESIVVKQTFAVYRELIPGFPQYEQDSPLEEGSQE